MCNVVVAVHWIGQMCPFQSLRASSCVISERSERNDFKLNPKTTPILENGHEELFEEYSSYIWFCEIKSSQFNNEKRKNSGCFIQSVLSGIN